MNQKITIQNDISLLPYNTFAIDCIASHFCIIKNPQHIQILITQSILSSTTPFLVLGGGSNILLTQERFEGLVVKNEITGIEIVTETETSVTLHVGAGENRDSFVKRTLDQGYCGIENLISVPGSVGAAPMQNIGAYGVDVQSVIESVEAIVIETGELLVLTNEQCEFGYRESLFKQKLKGKVIITAVTFTLQKYNPTTYQAAIEYGAVQDYLAGKEVTPSTIATAIASIRAEKLPDRTKIGTAGSFFKNPVLPGGEAEKILKSHPDLVSFDAGPGLLKFSAGQLIDKAGLKGITQGSVGTYKNHALVLVNHGGGTGKEIQALAQYIQDCVFDTFGVTIEPEVNYIS